MADFLTEGRLFAVATVLNAQGSTPLPPGARALIEPGGIIHGTVGGGAVEAAAIHHAFQALQTRQAALFDFDLQGPGLPDPSPVCGGRMRLLVDPCPELAQSALKKTLEALRNRKRGWWVTTVNSSRPWRIHTAYYEEGEICAVPGAPSLPQRRECFAADKAIYYASLPGQQVEMLWEPVPPVLRLVMVGGGHVGQAVAAQAALLGYEVLVVEDRREFALPELFPPGTQIICGDIEKTLADLPLDQDTCVVLATRGHLKDAEALRGCIRREMGYLGMIGSRRKIPLMRKTFLDQGWATQEQWDRIYAPIGLDIGAVTVQEIATATLAQIIAVRRKGSASRIALLPRP